MPVICVSIAIFEEQHRVRSPRRDHSRHPVRAELHATVVGEDQGRRGGRSRRRLDRIREAIAQNGVTVEKILLTHGHIDHAGGAAALEGGTRRCPIEGPHEADRFLLRPARRDGPWLWDRGPCSHAGPLAERGRHGDGRRPHHERAALPWSFARQRRIRRAGTAFRPCGRRVVQRLGGALGSSRRRRRGADPLHQSTSCFRSATTSRSSAAMARPAPSARNAAPIRFCKASSQPSALAGSTCARSPSRAIRYCPGARSAGRSRPPMRSRCSTVTWLPMAANMRLT